MSGRTRSTLRAVVVLGLVLTTAVCSRSSDVDIIIRGGTLIDGLGAGPRVADVAVDDGRIHSIGNLASLRGAREIDATELVVAPGFVDLHSHADLILLGDRAMQEQLLEAKIRQGVTTILVGNCGLGVAPSDAASVEDLSGVNGWMTPDGVRPSAMTTAAYLDRLEEQGVALNVGTLVPHGPVRISVMGLAPGEPSEAQLRSMRSLIEQGLSAGAFGLSTGLIYPPGMYSPTSELVALAETVAERDRLFTSHVRGSSETLLRATEELIEVARKSGVRAHHSHLEAVGVRFWPVIDEVLELEDAARSTGIRLSHDVFPYTRAATMMSAIFPPWSLDGGIPALLERLERPADRERIRRDIESRTPEWPPWQPGGWPHNLVGAVGWSGILVASIGPEGPQEYVGRSLAAIARDQERDAFDVVADLMLSQRGRVGQLVAEISGDPDRTSQLLSILTHPGATVISDAEDYGRGVPHPAHAGAFARALRLNREHALMPLSELVRRMTGYPASLIGLAERGRLAEGLFADLVVFDPRTVTDHSTWDEPRRFASGIHTVILNGTVVVDDARYLGDLHGRVLRSRD